MSIVGLSWSNINHTHFEEAHLQKVSISGRYLKKNINDK